MIKVNLKPSQMSAGPTDPLDGGGDEQVKRKGLTNLVVLLVLPIGMYLYASQAFNERRARIITLNAQLEELRAFNEKEANIVAEITKIKEDEKNVQMRIQELQRITQGRLAEVSAISLVRNNIKERMWATEIKVVDNIFTMMGLAQSEVDINLFQEDLTRNVLLSNVVLEESRAIQVEGQSFSEFRLRANLEKLK
jgi:Tfp pilus assembly protein PilN